MADTTTSTLRLTEATKIRLRKVVGELVSVDGKEHTMEDALVKVLDFYEKSKK